MEGMIGEIRMFGGNFAPRTWALCEGQLLPINSNQALFSILGTTYGGDGRTTFGLPDLRGRFALGEGQGPGLTDRRLGQKFGSETNTLTVANLPSHNHSSTSIQIGVSSEPGESDSPVDSYMGETSEDLYVESQDANAGAGTSGATGGGQSTNNIQPYLAVNYIICLQGVFPSRS
jgi:microcystin-dependent protein